jgi:ketosteroid isomerase-like protein
MSAEDELKDGYRRIIDAISRGDADGLDELMAPGGTTRVLAMRGLG